MTSTRAWISRYRWLLLIAATVALAIAVMVLAYNGFEDARTGFGSALVGGAIEIVFVGLLGGILTAAIKEETSRQEERRRQQAEELAQKRRDQTAALEEERRLNDDRLRLLLEVVTAYNEAKAVRRSLRAAGFARGQSAPLEPWQVEEFRRQMAVLSTAELAMEKTKRALRLDLGSLTRRDGIVEALRTVEDYLQTIIKEWEANGVGIAVGPVDVRQALPNVSGFLFGVEDGPDATFRQFVSTPMRFIQDCIRLDIATGVKAAGRELPDPEPAEVARTPAMTRAPVAGADA